LRFPSGTSLLNDYLIHFPPDDGSLFSAAAALVFDGILKRFSVETFCSLVVFTSSPDNDAYASVMSFQ